MRLSTFDTILATTRASVSVLPLLDKAKAYIVVGFSSLVGIAFLVSLASMVYFKAKNPQADIGLWVNVFLTCLGYVVGILTGLLGIPAPNPPGPGTPSAESTGS